MQKEKVEDSKVESGIREEQENTSPAEDLSNDTFTEEGKDEEGPNEEDPVATLEKDLTESKDKYLRLYSEFENFRRRTAKERIDLIGSATKELIVDLLPIMDDFERAFKAMEEKPEAGSSKEGMELIYNKFRKVLNNKGVNKIEIKAGDAFDEELHEAITQVPVDKKMEGKVVDVTESGYTLNDKVVRFAKVVTGAKS